MTLPPAGSSHGDGQHRDELHRHGDLAGSQHRRAPDIPTTGDRHRIGGYHDPVTTGSVEPDHLPAARLVHPTDLDVDHLADPGHIHVVAIDQFPGCTADDRDSPRSAARRGAAPAVSERRGRGQGDLARLTHRCCRSRQRAPTRAVTKAT